MTTRPGAGLARRPLHFFVLADCSGSMAADGKMRALNNAVREVIPHLVDVADANPHADLLVRVVAFSSGARWHVARPTPIDRFEWEDLVADGFTDLAAALDLLAAELTSPPMEDRALPPAVVLVSDGLPTDDHDRALRDLLSLPWGARSVRVAVGIGRDAHRPMLEAFTSPGIDVATANNPEALAHLIRWASVAVSRVASSPRPGPRHGPVPADVRDAEVVW